jgi:hypothetical protein
MNKSRFKWFAIGFLVTIVVILAIGFSGRMNVLAQEIITNESDFAVSDSDAGPITDDPLGRVSIPIQNEFSAYTDNKSFMEAFKDDSPPGGPLAPEGTTGNTNVLVIPAADFNNDGGDPSCYYFLFPGGYVNGSDPCYMMAPVNLPDGAVMSQMFISYYDNDEDYNLDVKLYRVSNYSGAVDLLAQFTSSSASEYVRSGYEELTTNTTVSFTYSYYIGMEIPSFYTRLYSVRIWY